MFWIADGALVEKNQRGPPVKRGTRRNPETMVGWGSLKRHLSHLTVNSRRDAGARTEE